MEPNMKVDIEDNPPAALNQNPMTEMNWFILLVDLSHGWIRSIPRVSTPRASSLAEYFWRSSKGLMFGDDPDEAEEAEDKMSWCWFSA